MKKSSVLTWVVVLVALVPVAYLAIIWNTLPQSVPVHFGADMKPNRIGSKDELWLSTGVMAVVSIGLYFLLSNLHRIDPKRRGTEPSAAFQKLATGIALFVSALSFVILLSAKEGVVMPTLLFPLIGLLFAFIGNYMHNIKPNYFAGLRLPWTLSSDENWRRTHQLAGKLWFAGGLLLAVVSLLVPANFMLPLFFGTVAVLTIIPAVYSYRLFKQHV